MSEGSTERKDMLRRAETRWMSVEDAEITVSARELALLGRALAAAEERAEKAEAALAGLHDPLDETVLAALRAHRQHNPEAYQRRGLPALEVLSMRFAIQAALAAASPPGEETTG